MFVCVRLSVCVFACLCVCVISSCQSLAQQALMGTINSSMHAVQQAQSDLGHVGDLPPLGHDLVSSVRPHNMDTLNIGVTFYKY